MRKALVALALAVSLPALAATLLAGPSGAAHREYTIAYLAEPAMKSGGEDAAKRLGVRVRFLDTNCHGPGKGVCGPQDLVRLYEAQIARHVDAIVHLRRSIELDPKYAGYARTDTDLASIRREHGFPS